MAHMYFFISLHYRTKGGYKQQFTLTKCSWHFWPYTCSCSNNQKVNRPEKQYNCLKYFRVCKKKKRHCFPQPLYSFHCAVKDTRGFILRLKVKPAIESFHTLCTWILRFPLKDDTKNRMRELCKHIQSWHIQQRFNGWKPHTSCCGSDRAPGWI